VLDSGRYQFVIDGESRLIENDGNGTFSAKFVPVLNDGQPESTVGAIEFSANLWSSQKSSMLIVPSQERAWKVPDFKLKPLIAVDERIVEIEGYRMTQGVPVRSKVESRFDLNTGQRMRQLRS